MKGWQLQFGGFCLLVTLVCGSEHIVDIYNGQRGINKLEDGPVLFLAQGKYDTSDSALAGGKEESSRTKRSPYDEANLPRDSYHNIGGGAAMQSSGASLAMPSGVNPAMMRSDVNPAMMRSDVNPAMMRSEVNPAMMRSGVNPAMMRSGVNPAMMRSGVNPAMMRSGVNPAMMRSGVNPAMMRSGGNYAMMRGGPNYAMMRGGPYQAMMRGGAAMMRGGPDQAMMRGGNYAMMRGGPDQAMMRGGAAMMRGGPDQAMMRGGPNQFMMRGGPNQAMMRGGPNQAMMMRGGPNNAMMMRGGPNNAMMMRGGPNQAMMRGGPNNAMMMRGGPNQAMMRGGPNQAMMRGGPNNAMMMRGGPNNAMMMRGGPNNAMMMRGGPNQAMMRGGIYRSGNGGRMYRSGGDEGENKPQYRYHSSHRVYVSKKGHESNKPSSGDRNLRGPAKDNEEDWDTALEYHNIKYPGKIELVAQDTPYPYGQNTGIGLHGPGQQHNPSVIADTPTNQPGGTYVSSAGNHVNYLRDDHEPDPPHYVQHGSCNVPPPPEPSLSSYIATLSYGEGYPTTVYHCSLTDRKPVTTDVVLGPNGHICTVSYYKTPSYALAPPLNDVHHQQPNKGPLTSFLDTIWPSYEKNSAGGGNREDKGLFGLFSG